MDKKRLIDVRVFFSFIEDNAHMIGLVWINSGWGSKLLVNVLPIYLNSGGARFFLAPSVSHAVCEVYDKGKYSEC